MNIKILPSLILISFMVSCVPGNLPNTSPVPVRSTQSGPTVTSTLITAYPSVEAVATTIAACPESVTSTPIPTMEFLSAEVEPSTWVAFMEPVREYLYYRKQAVITGDVQVLWDRYPDLQCGTDISKGINAEAFLINNMKALHPFDGNIFPELYDRIKVHQAGSQAEVLVHGMELYLYRDGSRFEDSGGEFKIVLYLTSPDSQSWTVYRTDEVTQAEWDS